jgi:hypothetical protein
MVKPKCSECDTSSSSVFHMNVIGKGHITICPTCNKKRVNAENKEFDKLDPKEYSTFNPREFEKNYYKSKI